MRAATSADLDRVQAVSVAAGERFRSVDDPRVAARADDPPIDRGELEHAAADGRLWVAVDDGSGEVVGFLLAVEIDGHAHVEEVSVHPDHFGGGFGVALLDAVVDPVTLTTFADVPWNRPYYERRGFRVLDEHELTDELRALRAREADAGLDPELRVVMRRPAR